MNLLLTVSRIFLASFAIIWMCSASVHGQIARNASTESSLQLKGAPAANRGQEEIGEIGGHPFLSAEQLDEGTGPTLFRKLSRERRWDSDLLRVLQDKLVLLEEQAPQHKDPALVQQIDQKTYDNAVREIEAQVNHDRAVQDDAQRPEDERARTQLELIDLTRRKAQLDIQHEATIDYDAQKTQNAEFTRELIRTGAEYAAAQHYLSMIDDAVAKTLDASQTENKFRLIMGLAFTFLVTALITGFFLIALKDETPRRMFLTQDRGLQFITLFSLVIAIVLFGVMNVLEGKELSALLGGLSGYILGRSNLGQASEPRHSADDGTG